VRAKEKTAGGGLKVTQKEPPTGKKIREVRRQGKTSAGSITKGGGPLRGKWKKGTAFENPELKLSQKVIVTGSSRNQKEKKGKEIYLQAS